MRSWLCIFLPLVLGAAATPAEQVGLGGQLAKVRAFARTRGEALWRGYGTAPFGFLLVGADTETLLCQPGAPQGFTDAGHDPETGCTRMTRPKSGLPASL